MAKCPKCGRHLRLIDWKPVCPGCGVNLTYYNSNETLLIESEKAEIEHANSQPGVDRAKAAFFGSKLTIIRIVLTFLPLFTTLIPLCRLTDASGQTKAIGVIQIAQNFVKLNIGKIFGDAFGGDLASLAFALTLIALGMFAINLLSLFASLGPHGKLRSFIFYGFSALCAIGAVVAFALGGKDVSKLTADYVSGTPFIGAFVFAAVEIFGFLWNVYIYSKGIPVEKTVCLIGGIPSDEYFKMVEDGVSELEIRKKMVAALTAMQDEIRRKEAEAEEKAFSERASRK